MKYLFKETSMLEAVSAINLFYESKGAYQNYPSSKTKHLLFDLLTGLFELALNEVHKIKNDIFGSVNLHRDQYLGQINHIEWMIRKNIYE